MKAILITKQFNLNGITYFPNTSLTKACIKFIAENRFFPGIFDVNPWYYSIINPITDKTAEKALKTIKKIFGEEYKKYFKIYTIE